MEHYLKILRLKSGFTEEDAKKAYRDQVKFWHPDRFPPESPRLQKKAHDRLAEINEAYGKVQEYLRRKNGVNKPGVTIEVRRQPSPAKQTEPEAPFYPWMHNKPPPPKEAKNESPVSETKTKEDDVPIVKLPNGDRYIGDLEDNQFHGQGAYSFAQGDRYVGDFDMGQPHGKGVFFFANGDKYEGLFDRGDIKGRGVYYFSNGDKYIGEFLNGKPHGAGTHFTFGGTRLEGKWKHGYYES